MKKILILLILTGCQSNHIQQEENMGISNSGNQTKSESKEEAYERYNQDFSDKIQRLDNAGKGSVQVCRISDYSSLINIHYSNEIGKKLVMRAYDEHIINSVSIYADKKQTSELLKFIADSDIKSKENRDIENLYLGRFSVGNSWVMLNSRYGVISGFWGDDWVERVLTPINPQQLYGCIKYVEPHL